MLIQPFEPPLDIPYYYPCNLPLIREALERQGRRSSLALLAAARLYGLPACSDTGLVKTYFNKLDYAEAVWRQTGRTEYAGLEEGLREARRLIAGGELVLATGTSYYLPYCEDYLSPKYIDKLVDPKSRLYVVDHWLAVYGIEETRLHVYDPVPARYVGPLSLQAFHDFWKGNRAIPELAGAKRKEELYSYCSVGVAAGDDAAASYAEALLRALATQAHEYLSAREIAEGERTYYFGHAVTRRLQAQAHACLADGAASLGALSAFVFDMRWSRYYFRDLLREAAVTLGAPFDGHAAAFEAILADWETAHKQLQGGAAPAERIARLGPALEALGQREYRLYEALWRDARSGGLFPKRPRAEDGDRRRAAVLRIVLDSCEDLNRVQRGAIPVELGAEAPLYGRNGNLDSLGLVSLLASVEQGIEEALGCGVALADLATAAGADSPYRTVDTLVGYLLQRLPAAG